MDSVAYVFLGVIAAASLVQAAVMVGLLVGAYRAGGRLERRVAGLEDELRPQLMRLREVADGVSRISERVQGRMPEIESAIGEATDHMRRTGDAVERAVSRPLGVLAAALAFTVARRYLARRAGRA